MKRTIAVVQLLLTINRELTMLWPLKMAQEGNEDAPIHDRFNPPQGLTDEEKDEMHKAITPPENADYENRLNPPEVTEAELEEIREIRRNPKKLTKEELEDIRKAVTPPENANYELMKERKEQELGRKLTSGEELQLIEETENNYYEWHNQKHLEKYKSLKGQREQELRRKLTPEEENQLREEFKARDRADIKEWIDREIKTELDVYLSDNATKLLTQLKERDWGENDTLKEVYEAWEQAKETELGRKMSEEERLQELVNNEGWLEITTAWEEKLMVDVYNMHTAWKNAKETDLGREMGHMEEIMRLSDDFYPNIYDIIDDLFSYLYDIEEE